MSQHVPQTNHANTAGESRTPGANSAPTANNTSGAGNALTINTVSAATGTSAPPNTPIPIGTAADLSRYPAENATAEGDRLYWGHVVELDPQRGTAVVALWTGKTDEPLFRCSTAGCEGVGQLKMGVRVQIRHVMAGEQQGETFVHCSPLTPASP